MSQLPSFLLILLIGGTVSLVFWFNLRLLFSRGSRGNVPSLQKARVCVRTLGVVPRKIISEMRSQYAPGLPSEDFAVFCVAISIATKQSLSKLKSPFILTEHLDSLSMVQLILFTEELFGMSISDDDAEKILTFEGLAKYVQGKVSAN